MYQGEDSTGRWWLCVQLTGLGIYQVTEDAKKKAGGFPSLRSIHPYLQLFFSPLSTTASLSCVGSHTLTSLPNNLRRHCGR